MSALTHEGLVNQKYALLPAFLQAKGLIRQHVSRCGLGGALVLALPPPPALDAALPSSRICLPASSAAPTCPFPLRSFNHFISSDLLKIIRAKGNERIGCDADPNFYLK